MQQRPEDRLKVFELGIGRWCRHGCNSSMADAEGACQTEDSCWGASMMANMDDVRAPP
jgi:hypothetical protein